MDANRRAEIIQAVEWHDRDLLAEIAELEAENKRLEAVNKESQRQLVLLDSDNEQLESERDMLKAAIATPELYVGVVEKVLAEERESAVAENSKLRTRLERLVAAILFIDDEWNKGTYSYEWFKAQEVVKAAIAEAKEVIP